MYPFREVVHQCIYFYGKTVDRVYVGYRQVTPNLNGFVFFSRVDSNMIKSVENGEVETSDSSRPNNVDLKQ